MPTYGCEHLNDQVLARIRSVRRSREHWLEDFVQYTCLECEEGTGSFKALNDHYQKLPTHQFAINNKNVYCMGCRDMVYDPSLVFTPKRRKTTQLTEEGEAYIAANTLPKPCGREGVRGFFNLCETCYMNAVLQMMVHSNLLGQYFLGMGHPLHTCPISNPEKKNDSDDSEDELGDEKDQKTCVACAFTELFSDANTVDQPLPAHAVNLLFASWKHIPSMSGKGQQDAQEWFTIIIDKLHESIVNPIQNASYKPNYRKHCQCFFHKVFYGRFSSEVTCDVCHKITTTEAEYSSIDLNFQKQKKRKKKLLKEAAAATSSAAANVSSKKNQAASQTSEPVPTLAECLTAYTASEALTQESQQIDCQSCRKKTTAQKQTSVKKLPAILTMHVKRFGMKRPPGSATNGSNGTQSSAIGTPEKYEGKLDFPLVLDMYPYTVDAEEGWYGDIPKCTYDLECVVVHQGDHAHAGHYYAFCRVPMGAGKEMRWFKFDDEIVSATTIEEVLRQQAYLLFYSLRDLPCLCGPDANGTNGDAKMENGD